MTDEQTGNVELSNSASSLPENLNPIACPACNVENEGTRQFCKCCGIYLNKNQSNQESTSSAGSEKQIIEEHKPDAVQKATAIFLSIVVTVIASLFVSAYAITHTISGGQPSAWGFEYLLCIFAPIPAIIGYAFTYSRLSSSSSMSECCVISAVSGIAISFALMILFGLISTGSRQKNVYDIKKHTASEEAFVKMALEGKYSDKEIRDHYQKALLSDYDLNSIEQTIFRAVPLISQGGAAVKGFSETIKPEKFAIIAEALPQRQSIAGFLASRSDAPYLFKLKVCDSMEPVAVKYLISDINTPPECLKKLASHPDLAIAQRAADKINRIVNDQKERERIHGRTWEFIESVGGILIEEPKISSDGAVTLPCKCDVSGQTTITKNPTTNNAVLVVRHMNSQVDKGQILVSVTTDQKDIAPKWVTSECPEIELGVVKKGNYQVYYYGSDFEKHPLGKVSVQAKKPIH